VVMAAFSWLGPVESAIEQETIDLAAVLSAVRERHFKASDRLLSSNPLSLSFPMPAAMIV
jgi:hypothetical protein